MYRSRSKESNLYLVQVLFGSLARWIANSIAVVIKDIRHSLGWLHFIANSIAAIVINPIGWVVVQRAILVIEWTILIVQRAVVVIELAILIVQRAVVPIGCLGKAIDSKSYECNGNYLFHCFLLCVDLSSLGWYGLKNWATPSRL